MLKRFLFIAVLFLVGCAPANGDAAFDPTPVKTSLDIQSITPTPIPEVTMGIVEVDLLNIREGPGTSYPTLGTLEKGDKFYVLGDATNSTNNRWLLISLPNNSFGWVTGDHSYVTVRKEIVDAATYSTWQKNVIAAKSASLTTTTSP